MNYIADAILFFIGIALCFEGIQWYRVFQLIVSAVIFGYIGVIIQQVSGEKNVFFIVPVFAIIGLIFCVKFYEWSLRVTSACITFYIIIQNYWHQAHGMYDELKGDLDSTKEFFQSFKNVHSLDELLELLNDLSSLKFLEMKNVFEQAADIMRTGVFIAIVAAIIVGIIVVKIHNYAVMIVTSALGAMFITKVAENYFSFVQDWYMIVLMAILLIGFIWQYRIKNNVEKD